MIITKIWFEDNRIYGLTDDGRTLWQSLLYYKRLMYATPEEREIDEDVSFESFEYDDPEPVGISKFFLSHPEINASAIARRLGIQQSLIAAYISGNKKPSKEREDLIMNEIRKLGEELMNVEW